MQRFADPTVLDQQDSSAGHLYLLSAADPAPAPAPCAVNPIVGGNK
jgi:hypothetical protein